MANPQSIANHNVSVQAHCPRCGSALESRAVSNRDHGYLKEFIEEAKRALLRLKGKPIIKVVYR
jgi:uncharacterized C2H2 Zn-finger protein